MIKYFLNNFQFKLNTTKYLFTQIKINFLLLLELLKKILRSRSLGNRLESIVSRRKYLPI